MEVLDLFQLFFWLATLGIVLVFIAALTAIHEATGAQI